MNEIYPVIPIVKNGRSEILILKPPGHKSLPEIALNSTHKAPQTPTWANKAPVSLAKLILEHDYNEKYPLGVCGLTNSNNMCYLNSVLQALLHVQPFMALINKVRRSSSIQIGSELQILNGLVQFAAEYEMQLGFGSRVSSAGKFYNIITKHPNFKHLEWGRQEDAQEFLGYLLEALEQTFDKALLKEEADQLKEPEPEAEPETEPETDDGWTQVGKHSKPIVERKAGIEAAATNPIGKLFGGKVRNVFNQRDQNPSITVDPCQEVLLDISPAHVLSVQDAIDHMMSPEEILIEKNNRKITASKQLEFLRTPPVLIMFFKRFTFYRRDDGEYDFGKIKKPISITPVKIMANGVLVHYKPTAIIYHHGSSATAGHYTTEVLKDDKWYAVDDDYVSVTASKGTGLSAYMAFYERV